MNLIPFLFLIFAQQVTVPPEIQGNPGAFISIPAATDCKQLQWVVLDQGLNLFPVELLKDSTVAVVSSTVAGRYRVLCYGAKDGVASRPAITTVIIGTPTPPVPPTPPEPEEVTKLCRDLKSVYAALAEPQKQDKVFKLVSVYESLIKTVFDESITTAGELLIESKKLTSAFLNTSDLKEIRVRLQQEMESFPMDSEDKLTPEIKKKISLKFKEISIALGRLIK